MPTLNESVRYEADDRPPPLLTAGLGLQYAILSLATVVLAPVVLITVAGESEAYFVVLVALLFIFGVKILISGGDFNLEDQLAMLDSTGQDWPSEAEVPLRLLRHYATTVRHQQFHDTDIVPTRLEPEGSAVGNPA
ncbi:MAG: hypothetical protein OXP11_00160 [Gammaproteobacteria bacterium]|nr:hypothetical protein [Gammaproteobacteria bacterium]